MNKIILLSVVSITCFSCLNLKTVRENKDGNTDKPEKVSTNMAGNLEKKDTTVTDIIDTIAPVNGYDLRYKQDAEMVKVLSPFFVKDICEPGNIHHPLYKEFTQKGNLLTAEVITKLKTHKNSIGKLEGLLGSMNALDQCKLLLWPQYYLSPNVVLYKSGERLKQYFHLDTTGYSYRLLKGNTLIGIVRYTAPTLNVKLLSPSDSLSYHKILSLKKEPILIGDGIRVSAVNSSIINRFGFVSNDDLFYSKCQKGTRTVYAPGIKEIPPPTPFEECETQAIEQFYYDSMLTHVITNTYRQIVDHNKKK